MCLAFLLVFWQKAQKRYISRRHSNTWTDWQSIIQIKPRAARRLHNSVDSTGPENDQELINITSRNITVFQLNSPIRNKLHFRHAIIKSLIFCEASALQLPSTLHISAWQSRFSRICSALLCILAKLPLWKASP